MLLNLEKKLYLLIKFKFINLVRSMEQKKRLNTVMIVFIILYIILGIFATVRILGVERVPGVVPISGLPEVYHMIVFFLVLPLILSIAAVLIFPRYIPSLLLKSKKIVYKRYNDAYIDIDFDPFNAKKFFIRAVYVFLLALGLLAIIIPLMSEEVARAFINTGAVETYINEGLDLRFVGIVLFGITFVIVFPIVIGLWSVGWSLQDAGLVHYTGLEGQKERWDKLFEIEPIHSKYNNYLKGYAGISSIVFLISLVVYISGFEGRTEDAIIVILTPAMLIIMMVPSYIVYGLNQQKFEYLRKGLPKAKKIAEAELIVK